MNLLAPLLGAGLLISAMASATAAPSTTQATTKDTAAIRAIITAIELGWERGDGAPLRKRKERGRVHLLVRGHIAGRPMRRPAPIIDSESRLPVTRGMLQPPRLSDRRHAAIPARSVKTGSGALIPSLPKRGQVHLFPRSAKQRKQGQVPYPLAGTRRAGRCAGRTLANHKSRG